MCHLSHVLVWEYNIPQRLAVACHVAGASGLNSKEGTRLDRLSSTRDYVHASRAGRLSHIVARARRLVGRALLCGRAGYYRAA
jgi:hypothetical protein